MADIKIRPDEITSILKQRIEGIEDGGADLAEVGTVLSVADGISRVHGLDNCMSLEMLDLPHDVTGLALNLERENVGTVLFGNWDKVRSEEHTSELQSHVNIVCRLLLEKKKKRKKTVMTEYMTIKSMM